MWLIIGEAFEESAERDRDVEDCHEFDLVFGEADIWGESRKDRVDTVYHR